MESNIKKKILFFVTKSNWGGAQQYIYDLALSMPTDLFDVAVVVGGDGELVDRLKEKGLKVYLLKNLKRDVSFFDDIRSAFVLFRILRKERPDIFHITSSKAGALGTVLGRFAGVPKIIFAALGWAFNEDRPTWQKKIIKFIHWFTVFSSHQTIVISNGTKAQMDWPFVQKKMIVVHLGRTVGTMAYKDEARGILETKVIDNTANLSDYHDDFWIGTIAELHPIKRLNRAIDAVASLTRDFPRLRYIIVHDGQLKAQLQQQVKDLGLQEHVFFTGTIPNASRLLPAFDLFTLPSKSEAFGYVLIEAGLAHVAVVATAVGGITDIVIDSQTGLLVPPDDTPALTKALRILIEDPQLRDTLAEAHFKRSATFTLEKMLDETIAVYNL